MTEDQAETIIALLTAILTTVEHDSLRDDAESIRPRQVQVVEEQHRVWRGWGS